MTNSQMQFLGASLSVLVAGVLGYLTGAFDHYPWPVNTVVLLATATAGAWLTTLTRKDRS